MSTDRPRRHIPPELLEAMGLTKKEGDIVVHASGILALGASRGFPEDVLVEILSQFVPPTSENIAAVDGVLEKLAYKREAAAGVGLIEKMRALPYYKLAS